MSDMPVRTWEQLSESEQAQALDYALSSIIENVIGGLRFSDELNGDDLQARIDACFDQAQKMQTPWFVHEYLADDEQVMDALRGMASCDAEDALYVPPSVNVVTLIPEPVAAC